MMKKINHLLLGLLLLLSLPLAAQDSLAIRYAATITQADLRAHLEVLASDEYEGRETGKKGQKMAADYIANFFKSQNITGPVEGDNSYLQKFDLEQVSFSNVYIKIKSRKKTPVTDIVFNGDADTPSEVATEAVFVGEGNESDYLGLNVTGKAVVIFSEGLRAYRNKIDIAKKKGARAYFVVLTDTDEKYRELIDRYASFFNRPRLGFPKNSESMPVFFLSPDLAAEIFKSSPEKLREAIEENKQKGDNVLAKIKPAPLTYHVKKVREKVPTENVLGYVEGSDLKEELLVISAHYDHLGVNGEDIYNGADDDGSGTVAVMEMAQAFKIAQNEGNGPRRSMLFLLVTGEEKGLLGSEYYTEAPVFPLENTITNLNIDMIGRMDKKYEGNPDYIYLIGADKISQELHDISEQANATYTNLTLDYTYNDENDPNRFYYRSDHYNFVKNNIPVIFYFNGVHEDYHQPSDTIEKIHFGKMEKIARLVFHTAWEVANKDERLKHNE